MSVLVFAELDNGVIKKTALEALYYGAQVANQLGTTATALAIGVAEESTLAEAGHYGVTKVLHASDAQLHQVNPMAYASVLAKAAEVEGSSVLVLAKSALADTIAARVAGKLRAGLAANVVALPESTTPFVVTRSIYTGKAFAKTSLNSDIKILVVKKSAVSPEETGQMATVEPFSPNLPSGDFLAKLTNVEKATGEVSLSDADIIVSGGLGMKSPDNWKLIEDLAHSLHAATGCSKPVSDSNWRPHHEHIGQTGIKVSPNLYIACGISGAIQHLAGVNGSRVIVVINKDPEAPFFKAADYGIVGDVFEVLPKLTKAAREQLN